MLLDILSTPPIIFNVILAYASPLYGYYVFFPLSHPTVDSMQMCVFDMIQVNTITSLLFSILLFLLLFINSLIPNFRLRLQILCAYVTRAHDHFIVSIHKSKFLHLFFVLCLSLSHVCNFQSNLQICSRCVGNADLASHVCYFYIFFSCASFSLTDAFILQVNTLRDIIDRYIIIFFVFFQLTFLLYNYVLSLIASCYYKVHFFVVFPDVNYDRVLCLVFVVSVFGKAFWFETSQFLCMLDWVCVTCSLDIFRVVRTCRGITCYSVFCESDCSSTVFAPCEFFINLVYSSTRKFVQIYAFPYILFLFDIHHNSISPLGYFILNCLARKFQFLSLLFFFFLYIVFSYYFLLFSLIIFTLYVHSCCLYDIFVVHLHPTTVSFFHFIFIFFYYFNFCDLRYTVTNMPQISISHGSQVPSDIVQFRSSRIISLTMMCHFLCITIYCSWLYLYSLLLTTGLRDSVPLVPREPQNSDPPYSEYSDYIEPTYFRNNTRAQSHSNSWRRSKRKNINRLSQRILYSNLCGCSVTHGNEKSRLNLFVSEMLTNRCSIGLITETHFADDDTPEVDDLTQTYIWYGRG